MSLTPRLDRALLVLLVTASCAPIQASADDRVAAGVVHFTDSDGLLVMQPSVSARMAVGDDVHVSGAYQADVITAATVDVRTSASTRPFQETRHGGSAAVDVAVARLTTLGARYALSYSPDYLSNAFGVRIQHEDDSRRHTLTLDLGGAFDSIGRLGDPNPSGEALALAGSVRWGVVISSTLVVDVSAALEHRRGYLESPYRFVTVGGSGSQVRLPEEVPEGRWRGAGQLGLRWAIAESFFVRASYRLHADDWGILGHNATVAGHLVPEEGWLITLSGRTLVQRGASFYSGAYATLPELPRYRTRDRTLSPHWLLSGAASIRVPFARVGGFEFGALLSARVTWRRYFDTPLLPERTDVQTSLTLIAQR